MMFEHLEYNPDTGEIYSHKKCKVLSGDVRNDGYRQYSLNRKNFLSGRLCWFLHHGEWPDGEIDHINRDRLDDRICNLSVVDRKANNANRDPHGEVKVRGVTRVGGRYRVQSWIDNAYKHHGYFDTLEEAAAKSKEVYG